MTPLRERLKFKFQPSGIICFASYTSPRGRNLSVQLPVTTGDVPGEYLAELAYMIAGSEHLSSVLVLDEIAVIYRESPGLEEVREQARAYEREQQKSLADRPVRPFHDEFEIID